VTAVEFYAPGAPQPQGNKTAMVRGGRAVLVEGRRTKARNAFQEWRATVRICADRARGDAEQLTGPVHVRVHFAVPKPKSAPKTKRLMAVKRPDLDKYIRAVLDAVGEAQVWHDDSQVVHLEASKDYPGVDGRTGVWVRITPMDSTMVGSFDLGRCTFVRSVPR
jgi:crossover junction endodeoxyribonuclease RusA